MDWDGIGYREAFISGSKASCIQSPIKHLINTEYHIHDTQC
jgi:hypothetical protein